MTERPDYLELGEAARLFPVLAETSKEGRATSIFLACLTHVDELASKLLASVGRRIGTTAKVDAFTEVAFKGDKESRKLRPDGMIRVRVGKTEWRALVEAKVGNSDLQQQQIEDYLKVARENAIDAVISISNQFATQPSDHPIKVNGQLLRRVSLFHWSWMHLMTEADLLLMNGRVADATQRALLNDLRRFLAHDSTGVKGFERMPSAWTEVAQTLRAGGTLSPRSDQIQAVVAAWHQELRDLSLILSRQVGVGASVQFSRAHRDNPAQRVRDDADALARNRCLNAAIDVPNAAGILAVQVDLKARTITASMEIRAPQDKQGTKARLNWLLKQLKDVEGDDWHVRIKWPGRGGPTTKPLSVVREDPGAVADEKKGVAALGFEICLIKATGAAFDRPKRFIDDLEKFVPEFYRTAGQNLRRWQAPAPRMREDRAETEDVTPAAIENEAEVDAVRLGEAPAS